MIIQEAPRSNPFFSPIDISPLYNREINSLPNTECSELLSRYQNSIPTGFHIFRGIPFVFGKTGENNLYFLKDGPETRHELQDSLEGCKYIVFAHSADLKASKPSQDGIISPMMGNPRLGETIATYSLEFEDGSRHSVEIKRRFQINEFSTNWGEGAFESVPCANPRSLLTNTEDISLGRMPEFQWGQSQTRVMSGDVWGRYSLWLYAMENPSPGKKITAIIFRSGNGTLLLSGITACALDTNPLRWEPRKKALIRLPDGEKAGERNERIAIDLGQVISVQPVPGYENGTWESGYNNQQPALSESMILVEYAAHPSAYLYLGEEGGVAIPVSDIQTDRGGADGIAARSVPEAAKRVTLKVKDGKSGKTVPVKIHIHGESGEYLPPMNRHRIPNWFWYEDYSTDFVHGGHICTYIDGEAEYKFPLGDIYLEVSKGFEIKPVRKKCRIDGDTGEIVVELDRLLPWRDKGWVTADTHVHFLSPHTALLEGEAEGVNVVNLLASQWGELFTNIGDFDGRSTLGGKECGGQGEYLVRVGTENRQHILGHISLLGYNGRMILPLTTGGPDESALGDPVEETLCGWAQRCREQGGISILPHFPNPRAEGAAAIVSDLIDGIEMTSWGDLYSGINPYTLSDWYRYLNCGYHVPAVGGTDKMSADTAVGTVRTYAKIKDGPFTYESWKEAVKSGHTFVTYGPLMEFTVEGREAGSRIELPDSGGTLQVCWNVASVTVPVTKVELVVNGEIRESSRVDPTKGEYAGSWPLRVDKSCWIALRVRGCQPGRKEAIMAHSSVVMAFVQGERCFSPADAMTILEQIEGVTAYVSTIATRAEEKVYKQLLMTLTSAHRALHNRLHRAGIYHKHTVMDDHHKNK